MEQRVDDGLQVLECVFLNQTEYLNLAFVLRVVDDEEVDGVIYKKSAVLGLLLLSLHLCSGDADSDNLKGMSTMMTRVQFSKASQCRKSCLTALNDKK